MELHGGAWGDDCQVPISLLILSRSFALTTDGGAGGEGGRGVPSESAAASAMSAALAQSISSLDSEIVTEVVLEAATPEERRSAEIRSLKLEAYEHQV